MVTLGQILGTVVGFPLLIFLVNLFYYSNKYNDDAELYYKEYMNNSYFYSVEYKKYFSIMCFLGANRMHWPYGMKVILTVNRDDMNNPEYGTKENPVPVLKDVGVDESIRDYDKDYDKAYMDSFYRENVIRYLKYKMPKSEFKRRFKNKE